MNNQSFENITHWEKTLSPNTLPVDPLVKHQVIENINKKSSTAKKLSKIMQKDPILCLQLFNHANKSLSASGNETYELGHTISLLGFPNVENLVKNSIEQDANVTYSQYYQQQISISLHAAYQAQSWSHKNPHWSPFSNEIFWSSLFHYSPVWALWHNSGDKMVSLLKERAVLGGSNSSKIERSILGTSLSDICFQLSNAWFLPKLSQMAWKNTLKNNAKLWITLSHYCEKKIIEDFSQETRYLSTSPSFTVELSNKMCEEADWDWLSRKTLRLQKILAALLQCTLDEAIAFSHENAAKCSRLATLPNTIPCAVQLLSKYKKLNDIQSVESIEAVASSSTISSPEVEKTLNNEERTHNSLQDTAINDLEFEQSLSRFTQHPSSLKSVDDVMQLTATLLCQTVNLERVTISLLNLKIKEVRTHYSCGCEDFPPLKNFSHALQKGDLFNKLLQKSACLRLNKANHSKIWSLLPKHFQEICDKKEFFMMSLFANKHPIALLYADCGISHKPLDDKQYKQFKQLSQAVCQCLSTLQTTL